MAQATLTETGTPHLASQERDACIQEALRELGEVMSRLQDLQSKFRSLLTIDWRGCYEREIASLVTFGYLQQDGTPHESDAELPIFEEIEARFSPEARSAITHLRDRRLILKPRTAFSRKVRALDAAPVESIRSKTYVNDAYGTIDRSPDAYDPISAWDAVWIEGAPTPSVDTSYDDPKKPLRDRRAAFHAHRTKIHPSLAGTDRHDWDALLRQSLTEGIPIDLDTWTALDDDQANAENCFPGAVFGDDRAYFLANHPENVLDNVRFRSSVREDVQP